VEGQDDIYQFVIMNSALIHPLQINRSLLEGKKQEVRIPFLGINRAGDKRDVIERK
jgi:hypothetical protein